MVLPDPWESWHWRKVSRDTSVAREVRGCSSARTSASLGGRGGWEENKQPEFSSFPTSDGLSGLLFVNSNSKAQGKGARMIEPQKSASWGSERGQERQRINLKKKKIGTKGIKRITLTLLTYILSWAKGMSLWFPDGIHNSLILCLCSHHLLSLWCPSLQRRSAQGHLRVTEGYIFI